MSDRTIITDPARVLEHHRAAVRLVVHGDREAYTRHLILDRSECLKLYRKAREAGADRWAAYLNATCPHWSESYSGPGYGFARRPLKRNGRRWIVWTQTGGLDV